MRFSKFLVWRKMLKRVRKVFILDLKETRRKTKLKATSGIMLAVLLVSMLTAAFNIPSIITANGSDTDQDGIDDYEEYIGHVSSLDGEIYFTDNASESTDGDPYDDGQEVDGHSPTDWGEFGGPLLGVVAPGNHPLVPAYPDLKVNVTNIKVETLCEITSTRTLANGSSWTVETETTRKTTSSWSKGFEISMDALWAVFKGNMEKILKALKAKIGTDSKDETTTRALRSTLGWSKEEWSKAIATKPHEAAKLEFHINVRNDGTSLAQNVWLIFNVKIGDNTVDTVQAGDSDHPIALSIRPMTCSEEYIVKRDVNGYYISVSADELKLIENGAPISIDVTGIGAEVPYGDVGRDWNQYMFDIDGKSARLMVDFGDGEVRDYRVWAGVRGPPGDQIYITDVSLMEAIDRTVGIEKQRDSFYIGTASHVNKPVDLEDWTFGFPEEVYNQLEELKDAKQAAGEDWTFVDLLDIPIRQGWTIIMEAPDIIPPKIHWAVYSQDKKEVIAGVADNREIENVTAHVQLIDGTSLDVELTDDDGDSVFTKVLPQESYSGYVIAHDGTYDRIWHDIQTIPGPFKYKKQITIHNPNDYTLVGFQVLVVLDTESLIADGKMRPDCGDIRFLTQYGQEIPYWIQSGCNSSETRIWVKIPGISPGFSSIFIIYGNALETSRSSYSDTMEEPPHLFWNKTYGNPFFSVAYDYGAAVDTTVDSEDNIVTVGRIHISGPEEAYIMKHDPDGNPIWNKRVSSYDGFEIFVFQAVAVDSKDNIIVTGQSSGGFIIMKYNSSGNILFPWPKILHGGPPVSDVVVDHHDNIIVTGAGWLMKFNPDGHDLWGGPKRVQHETLDVWTRGVAVDSKDNVLVTGRTHDFNYYTMKYDKDGNEVLDENWPRTFDSTYLDLARDVVVDSGDNIIVTGQVTGPTVRIYTIKYDSLGRDVWGLPFEPGDGINVRPSEIALDSEDNIIITSDHAFMKFDPDFRPLWPEPMLPGMHAALGLAVDSTNNLIVVGSSSAHPPIQDWDIKKYSSHGVVPPPGDYPTFQIEDYEEVRAKPIAEINSITIEEAQQGNYVVTFNGSGTDEGGTVVSYDWRSSKDGRLLNWDSLFTIPLSDLSVGIHVIYLSVVDNDGTRSIIEDTKLLRVPKTRHVRASPGTYDYQTIQAAVEDVARGSTIIVENGIYEENVDVHQRDGSEPLIIMSESGSADCIVRSPDPDDDVFSVYADYVAIHEFTMTSSTGLGLSGIRVSGHARVCSITGNNISNNYQGICLVDSDRNTITDNLISNNQKGIALSRSSDNTICNNCFNNTINAVDDRGINNWNITKKPGTNIVLGSFLGGNYWSDYAGIDTNGDRLGDTQLPYDCSAGIENGGDYLPLIPLYTKTDRGVTTNIEIVDPSDIESYVPEGTDLSNAIAINVEVTDATPEDPTDDAYTDIVISVGELDIETCRVYKQGYGFLPEVLDVTQATEASFARDVDNNCLIIRLFVGDPLFGVIPHPPPEIIANINIHPDTLTFKSRSKWITCYIELPEGYSVSDIDILSIRLNDSIPVSLLPKPRMPVPTEIGDYDNDDIPDLMVKFNMTQLLSQIDCTLEMTYRSVTLTIKGVRTGVTDGRTFEGKDTVKIVARG